MDELKTDNYVHLFPAFIQTPFWCCYTVDLTKTSWGNFRSLGEGKFASLPPKWCLDKTMEIDLSSRAEPINIPMHVIWFNWTALTVWMIWVIWLIRSNNMWLIKCLMFASDAEFHVCDFSSLLITLGWNRNGREWKWVYGNSTAVIGVD